VPAGHCAEPAAGRGVLDFPATGNINSGAFDASATTDEGGLCGTRCTYRWDFGDFTTDTGERWSRGLYAAGSIHVTLTVTDSRGGVGSTRRAS
jgi:hypothetical protein